MVIPLTSTGTTPSPRTPSAPRFAGGLAGGIKTARWWKAPTNVLFGRGAGAIPASKRVISTLGAVDEDLLDARRMESLFSKHTQTSGLFADGDQVLRHNLEAADEHIPGPLRAFFSKNKPLGDSDRRAMDGLAAAGMPVTEAQYTAMRKDQGSFGSVGRWIGRTALGDAPIRTMHQRYTQGGILGPGGLVFGDLALPPALKRDAASFGTALGDRDWRKAGRYGLQAGIGAGAYGLGTFAGYGMPLMAAHEAWQLAPEAGASRFRSAGASLLNSAGAAAVSPLGWAATPLYGPISSVSHRVAGAPELGELQARVAARRGLYDPQSDPRTLLAAGNRAAGGP